MNRCTTAFLYTSFKTAIGTGSALIGSSVLAAAGHVEYSEISVASKAGSLGGATLGFIDYILQELIHTL